MNLFLLKLTLIFYFSVVEEKSKQECIFKPQINKEKPNYDSNEPILIKGFAKHLDQMEKARKAKRDKIEREKEVFLTGDNWSKDNIITIPKPFNLSYNKSKDKNRSKSRKDINLKIYKDAEMKECSFKPITNES